MPCTSEPSHEDIEREQKRLDIMARLACNYCKLLDLAKLPIPVWARDWWEYHKSCDADRLAEEARDARMEKLRKDGIKKLTKEELEALGIV